MEASISNGKICYESLFRPSMPRTRNPPFLSYKAFKVQNFSQGYRRMNLRRDGLFGNGLVMGCAKGVGGSVAELEAEMKSEEKWSGMKCEGRNGIVELMECLEKEAIMGEDEGKEASDYNRRAQIFDKSSKVFQALKEENNQCSTP